MQTDRSDDVVARVVAWHNRHPLATRITANQVHSVGVVSLPFAVQGAVLQAAADTPQTPEVAESAAPGVPVAEPATVDLSDAAVLAAAPADAALNATAPVDPASPAGPPPVTAVLVQLPPRPARWNLPARWRARAAWRALFSEDFIAPLRPGRIASWAALHAVSKRPLDATAPQRDVALDPARRHSADGAPEGPLFVLTAAIGVDDQRLRVLLAPAGPAVLGPRHYSRSRVAALAGGSLATLALLVGAGLWQPQHTMQAAAPAASAVSATSARVASAPAASAPVATAAASVPAAASAVPLPMAAAPAASTPVADPPTDHAQAHGEPSSQAVKRASTHSPMPPEAVDAEPTATAAEAAPRVAGARPRRGRVDVPPLVAKLDDAQRHELRLAGRALRGEPAHPVHARAWALVTQPLSNRRQSERVAAQLHAVALLQPMPMRAELMQAEGGWRAVFWPFPTERDAEKVRLALADKGLRTQIVEF